MEQGVNVISILINIKYKGEIQWKRKLKNLKKYQNERCLSKQMDWKQKDWDEEVSLFKQQNCSLF